MIDNIIIGTPLVSDDALGVLTHESTLRLTREGACNDNGDMFLPAILKQAGIVKSTSQVRAMQKQRDTNPKFNTDPFQNLWRKLDTFEMTPFKIGKHVFWLIVGE